MSYRERPALPTIDSLAIAEADSQHAAAGAADAATDIASMRSRASSIISTGTMTSINTLPQAQTESYTGPIDVILGRRNFRITARPGSILSISSYDHPAPPYSVAIGGDAARSTATLTGEPSSPSSPPPPTGQPSSPSGALGSADASSVTDPVTPMPRRPQPSLLITNLHERRTSWSVSTSRSSSPPSPPLSPLSSSTNAISAHYTSVVRTIDTNHQAELARLRDEHAFALAQPRNDIDAAYRIPYREARDRGDRLAAETESLKMRAEEQQEEYEALLRRCEEAEAALEASKAALQAAQNDREDTLKNIEMRANRARNEIEDLWEGRWRDRMRLEAEEIQTALQRGRAQGRDEQRQYLEALLEKVTEVSSPAEYHAELVQWKDEILRALQEFSESNVV